MTCPSASNAGHSPRPDFWSGCQGRSSLKQSLWMSAGRGGAAGSAGRRARKERRPSCGGGRKRSCCSGGAHSCPRSCLRAIFSRQGPQCPRGSSPTAGQALGGHGQEHSMRRGPQSGMDAPAWCLSVQQPHPAALRTPQLGAMPSPAPLSPQTGEGLCKPLPSASLRTTLPARQVQTKPAGFTYAVPQQQTPPPSIGCLAVCRRCSLQNPGLEGWCCRPPSRGTATAATSGTAPLRVAF